MKFNFCSIVKYYLKVANSLEIKLHTTFPFHISHHFLFWEDFLSIFLAISYILLTNVSLRTFSLKCSNFNSQNLLAQSWKLLSLLYPSWTFWNFLAPSWTFLSLLEPSWTFFILIFPYWPFLTLHDPLPFWTLLDPYSTLTPYSTLQTITAQK